MKVVLHRRQGLWLFLWHAAFARSTQKLIPWPVFEGGDTLRPGWSNQHQWSLHCIFLGYNLLGCDKTHPCFGGILRVISRWWLWLSACSLSRRMNDWNFQHCHRIAKMLRCSMRKKITRLIFSHTSYLRQWDCVANLPNSFIQLDTS